MTDMQFTFTPRFESASDGTVIASGVPTEGGLPQARMAADTRCSFCGRGFKAGDHVIARLAIPPTEATWRHAECGEIQPHWQIRQGSWEIPSGETIFSAMRSFDDHARRRDE